MLKLGVNNTFELSPELTTADAALLCANSGRSVCVRFLPYICKTLTHTSSIVYAVGMVCRRQIARAATRSIFKEEAKGVVAGWRGEAKHLSSSLKL